MEQVKIPVGKKPPKGGSGAKMTSGKKCKEFAGFKYGDSNYKIPKF
jgi:hypothetical protein